MNKHLNQIDKGLKATAGRITDDIAMSIWNDLKIEMLEADKQIEMAVHKALRAAYRDGYSRGQSSIKSKLAEVMDHTNCWEE